jgi:hypothetical protein
MIGYCRPNKRRFRRLNKSVCIELEGQRALLSALMIVPPDSPNCTQPYHLALDI